MKKIKKQTGFSVEFMKYSREIRIQIEKLKSAKEAWCISITTWTNGFVNGSISSENFRFLLQSTKTIEHYKKIVDELNILMKDEKLLQLMNHFSGNLMISTSLLRYSANKHINDILITNSDIDNAMLVFSLCENELNIQTEIQNSIINQRNNNG